MRITILFLLMILLESGLNGQSNSIFLSFPNEKNQKLDNEKFSLKISELEKRYDKLIIIKLSNDSSRFNDRYKQFVADHPNWGIVFYSWTSSRENMEYTILSESNISVSASKLLFSVKKNVNVENLKNVLKDAIVDDKTKKNYTRRYYFEVSKNPDKYACITGELFDYLYADINAIMQEVDISSSQITNNLTQVTQEDSLASYIKRLLSEMTKIGNRIGDVEIEIKNLKPKKNEALYYRLENSFRFATEFYENSFRLFYHGDDKNNSPHYFAFGISAGELQGNTQLENYAYQNGSSIYSITGVQEQSQTKFNGLSVGYKHIKEIDRSFELHTRIGIQLNRIASSNYRWSSGEMDVRGKLEGIGDEIINVPELGFQDNVKLAGIKGENEIRRFFGSLDADITLHYNLDKIDFFLGGGGIVSTKIQPRKTDASIFNGYQSNGLMSTVKPMALTKFYFTLGASLIF